MPPRRQDDFSDSDDFSDDLGELDDDDLDLDLDGTSYPARKKRQLDKGKGRAQDADEPAKRGKDSEKGGLARWEGNFERSWDAVQEDEDGSLEGAVESLVARGRRRRLQNAAPVRRTIIRHLVILLDLSETMTEKDLRPSRFDLTLEYVKEFVTEWFDQNPLGQIGITGLRAGVAEQLAEMGGNAQDILRILQDKRRLEPSGEPSLQNGLDMARSGMSHLPSHSSREVLLLLSSLTSCDPGSISDTIEALVSSKVRVSTVCLAAETKLARDLSIKTGGTFGVALNEGHLRDLLWESIPPPALTGAPMDKQPAPGARQSQPAADLMMMGFPTRLPDSGFATLCACHANLKPEGFLCPRCGAKLCDVPTDCDVCGLLVVSSPHLARSYHHLFPVPAWAVVPLPGDDAPPLADACGGCSSPFPPLALAAPPRNAQQAADDTGLSPTGRYRCPKCKADFCAECDAFVHEVLHVCPGCG